MQYTEAQANAMEDINANADTHNIRSEGEDQASYERFDNMELAINSMKNSYEEAYTLAESGHIESAAFAYGYAMGIETLIETGIWSHES